MLWTTTNILICETGYPLAIDSRDRTPKQILQDIQNNHPILFRRTPKVFGDTKKKYKIRIQTPCANSDPLDAIVEVIRIKTC